jgi:hypothetical protein
MNRIGRQQNPTLHSGIIGRRIVVGMACAWMMGLACAHAREFDVRSGELKLALDAFIAQSGVQLIYKIEDVQDLSTRGIKGKDHARCRARPPAGRHAPAHPPRAGRGHGADRAACIECGGRARGNGQEALRRYLSPTGLFGIPAPVRGLHANPPDLQKILRTGGALPAIASAPKQ